MLGSPMPTKQAAPSRSARAAATVIISSVVQLTPRALTPSRSSSSQAVNVSRSRLIASHSR